MNDSDAWHQKDLDERRRAEDELTNDPAYLEWAKEYDRQTQKERDSERKDSTGKTQFVW